jgi:hypothetical protein
MAAADITLGKKIATVECDDNVHKITIRGAGASLVNVGASPVFISMVAEEGGDLSRDGLQHDGEIELAANDSIPLPADASFVRHQCAVGRTSKLWYVPRAG